MYMETLGLAGIVLIAVLVFRSSLRKINKAVEENITVEVLEGRTELYQRSQEAYNELVDTLGKDFHTPEEIYNAMNKRCKI